MFNKIVFIFFILVANTSFSQNLDSGINYSIYADINPDYKILYGRAEITPDEDIEVDISNFDNIKINGKAIKEKLTVKPKVKQGSKISQQKNIASESKNTLIIAAGKKLLIEYEYPLNSYNDYSDHEHVILSGNWYPGIKELANYQLTVNLPKGYQAISEADNITRKFVKYKRIETSFSFPYPLDKLTLVASKNYQNKFKIVNNIRIETWFIGKNQKLADSYIEHAIDYLNLYQKILGPYPYKRFAMVESPLPSGFSMPTYTLLGGQVIALPFIVKTSLGHEILHQWFGNSVYVDQQHGNWCEGLTTYFADYYYAHLQGQAKQYRKNILTEYSAYVNNKNQFPVREFKFRKDKASSVIGYGKVAMIFHQLNLYYQDEGFLLALRKFIKKNRFKKASWHDLQREFEAIDGQSMYEDFTAWLTRADIANISINQPAKLEISKGQLWLNFSLQQTAIPYHLHLPLVLQFEDGSQKIQSLHFTKQKQSFNIKLEQPPILASLDPNFNLMRDLSDEEKIANIAWLLGSSDKAIVVIDDAIKELYQPLFDKLNTRKQTISSSDISFEQIKNHSLIITDQDKDLVDSLFGEGQFSLSNTQVKGVQIKLKRNPYNDNKVIVLLSSSDQEQAKLAAKKISHYGKYSQLVFRDGKLKFKSTAIAKEGITLFKQITTRAIKPPKTQSLSDIITDITSKLGNNRTILIGEQHDLFQHHLNQLLLIKKLKQSGFKVAIGLEMFQQPYQKSLDDYLAKKITESEFLTQSEYFTKWRYDYNLYKPIIDYALAQQIPLIALNIEGDINRQVAKQGIYSLDKQQQKQLPQQMDLSNRQYRNDLKSVYTMHLGIDKFIHKDTSIDSPLDRQIDEDKFNYFLQSQTLWDETMAQTATDFLAANPKHILVILAGNGHLRYRYGIADRIERITGKAPIVIVQDEDLDTDIADYNLLTMPLSGAKTPTIGVYLDTKVTDKVVINKVVKRGVGDNGGLKKDDIILALDGKALITFTDLKLALLYADSSKPIAIKIQRDKKIINKILNFSPDMSHHANFLHGKHTTNDK